MKDIADILFKFSKQLSLENQHSILNIGCGLAYALTTCATEWEELTVDVVVHNFSTSLARPLEVKMISSTASKMLKIVLEVILNQYNYGSHHKKKQ